MALESESRTIVQPVKIQTKSTGFRWVNFGRLLTLDDRVETKFRKWMAWYGLSMDE